ncbi:hypothetical protein Kpol_251p4 [Vanderwaltozyma polyspora DSM 70294]|uniref:Protein kinase domain-containing protein n=1 Tax=Vanderwaltozyma polyspora (strain ATCC 22028 / DSM 70294 / BCRC 21397 / CBS 2163 / NBRC 10782 / NRRL Y-8283 / UCD 57-17) TaxID=436907 RepID=A7TTD3_VANPO|nr:uncharacterized protein Kpol_251p4 [Vanderwaltozyma polyspora DSM 70294]EDO14474.1 hypothetical protein Kpol_251p4 [Vanderwaltozyma polyspora DSM 70294]
MSQQGMMSSHGSINRPPPIASPPKVLDSYVPGTIVIVGIHKVEVVKYLAEGGFAKIYVVKFLEYLSTVDPNGKEVLQNGDQLCLKRVLVQDDNGLNEMRNEVEVMRKLKGAPCVVQYYDSNASRRIDGAPGYEVLLLMELCSNNSLLDYMNQRLATKLSEDEILKIMFDVTLAVAQMHYLPSPLIHRDIKIENVLVDSKNNFKLCDFGSTSTCLPIVSSHQDIAILTQNIYVHTTPQYRSPEMIDLYRCLPVNEKSDIWALGVFLYKLMFYTTPFERTGQFAILHSKYEFPLNNYSSKLINLIIVMLAENPNLRPNIYQVLNQICYISGIKNPMDDAYGLGAYSFEKYTEYQSKLQNYQNQMYQIQVRKIKNHGLLNPGDDMLLDDLFINSFEVASKVPVSIGEHRTQPMIPFPGQENTQNMEQNAINGGQMSENNGTNVAPETSGKASENPTVTDDKVSPPIENETKPSDSNEIENSASLNEESSEVVVDAQSYNISSSRQSSFVNINNYTNNSSISSTMQHSNLNNIPARSTVEIKSSDELSTSSTAKREHLSSNPFPRLNTDVNVASSTNVNPSNMSIDSRIPSQTLGQSPPPSLPQSNPIPIIQQGYQGMFPSSPTNGQPLKHVISSDSIASTMSSTIFQTPQGPIVAPNMVEMSVKTQLQSSINNSAKTTPTEDTTTASGIQPPPPAFTAVSQNIIESGSEKNMDLNLNEKVEEIKVNDDSAPLIDLTPATSGVEMQGGLLGDNIGTDLISDGQGITHNNIETNDNDNDAEIVNESIEIDFDQIRLDDQSSHNTATLQLQDQIDRVNSGTPSSSTTHLGTPADNNVNTQMSVP